MLTVLWWILSRVDSCAQRRKEQIETWFRKELLYELIVKLLRNRALKCQDFHWAKASCLGSTREVKSAPSSPSRSPTPCRFKHSHLASRVSQGERRVSASWLACTLTLDRWVPKWTPFLYAIFGLLRNRFCHDLPYKVSTDESHRM